MTLFALKPERRARLPAPSRGGCIPEARWAVAGMEGWPSAGPVLRVCLSLHYPQVAFSLFGGHPWVRGPWKAGRVGGTVGGTLCIPPPAEKLS